MKVLEVKEGLQRFVRHPLPVKHSLAPLLLSFHTMTVCAQKVTFGYLNGQIGN